VEGGKVIVCALKNVLLLAGDARRARVVADGLFASCTTVEATDCSRRRVEAKRRRSCVEVQDRPVVRKYCSSQFLKIQNTMN
jgi:hypothetical protein